ncbi:MAG: hypothetical protein RR314_00800 [Oscillospiraceae bacterium]
MRRLISLILSAALLASLCGCASMFDKEYLSKSEYTAPKSSVPVLSEDGAIEVKNYFGLRIAVSQLIAAHADSVTLDFREYDGSINDDIAAACKDVSTNTALGAYCVDFISYDLDRIVAYYEAKIYVNYTKTAEEVEAILTASTYGGVLSLMREAMGELRESMVIKIGSGSAGEDDVLAYVDRVCREDPLCCIYKPKAQVTEYSGTGMQRIFDITIDYGGERDALLKKRQELSESVNFLAAQVTAETKPYRAFQAASLVVGACTSESGVGDTAYDALVLGIADSEGMAQAYAAVCAASGVNCRTVSGRLDKSPHFWNIIELDGAYYHVDISVIMAEGYAASFLLSDASMWGRYWWDTELYPTCEGTLTYTGLMPSATNA